MGGHRAAGGAAGGPAARRAGSRSGPGRRLCSAVGLSGGHRPPAPGAATPAAQGLAHACMACLHESADSKLSSQPHSVVILSGTGALVSVCFHCMTAQTFCVCEQVSLQLAQRPDRNTGLTCSQSIACQAAGHAALRCLLTIGTCRRCNKQIQQTASEWKARQGDECRLCRRTTSDCGRRHQRRRSVPKRRSAMLCVPPPLPPMRGQSSPLARRYRSTSTLRAVHVLWSARRLCLVCSRNNWLLPQTGMSPITARQLACKP